MVMASLFSPEMVLIIELPALVAFVQGERLREALLQAACIPVKPDDEPVHHLAHELPDLRLMPMYAGGQLQYT